MVASQEDNLLAKEKEATIEIETTRVDFTNNILVS